MWKGHCWLLLLALSAACSRSGCEETEVPSPGGEVRDQAPTPDAEAAVGPQGDGSTRRNSETGVASRRSVCSADGWCLQYPPPRDHARTPARRRHILHEIWGASADDIYAVGSNGLILHFDGSTWSTVETPGDMSLFGIWGSGPGDIFAVGAVDRTAEGVISSVLHSDGSRFQVMPTPSVSVTAVWGSGPSDVYAVGLRGSILHYDGTDWTEVHASAGARLSGIWGSGANDAYAVGHEGRILHYDGRAWSPVQSGTTERLYAIWGSGASDIFVAGASGTVLHYDGNSWSAQSSNTEAALFAIFGRGPADVHAVGSSGVVLHYDGSSWQRQASGVELGLTGVWAADSGEQFAVGRASTIIRRSGPAATTP